MMNITGSRSAKREQCSIQSQQRKKEEEEEGVSGHTVRFSISNIKHETKKPTAFSPDVAMTFPFCSFRCRCVLWSELVVIPHKVSVQEWKKNTFQGQWHLWIAILSLWPSWLQRFPALSQHRHWKGQFSKIHLPLQKHTLTLMLD